MKTRTPSVIVRCVCLLLVLGLNCNTPVSGRRILNGLVADPKLYPFLVHLTTYRRNKEHICGGTVISDHFILTAAHCLDGTNCGRIEIRASNYQFGSEPKYHGFECHIHFRYKSNSFENDIGLLETKDDLLQDREITAYNLPSPGTTYALAAPAIMVGWGRTQDKIIPEKLLNAEVRVYGWDDCNDKFKEATRCADDMRCPPERIPHLSFCTLGDQPKPPGACIGDLGGPIIIDETIAGVVSGVILDDGTCETDTPSLHTSVSEYIPWIMTTADMWRRAKRSTDMKNATIAKPLRNYTSRAGLYQ